MLTLLALLTLSLSPPAEPPLCRVRAATTQDATPGFYTVVIALRPECPPDAVADVRFESFVGGSHPSEPRLFRITRDEPLIRSGIPWFWRGAWVAKSGRSYPFILPGMKAPLR